MHPSALSNSPSKSSTPKQNVIPDRSEAEWRDLLFIIPVSNLKESATLPFVIPTEAKRSGGICSSTDPSWKCFPEKRRAPPKKINLQTQKRPAASRALLLACFC